MRIHDLDRIFRVILGGVVFFFAGLSASAAAAQMDFRPGFNLFSVAQDVQVGKENAAQVEKQVPVLNDETATRYLNELGRRLSGYAPKNQPDYAWQFKVLNSGDINAFALPGGYIFVNRATLESAEDEAQLAGVLAHEEGHVVMRHGTHQASETVLARAPLEMLGGFFGQEGSFTSMLMQFGIGAGAESLLLHNSRSMEAQADSVGAYILYRAGYDPRACAQFFEVVQQEYPQHPNLIAGFLSDHPDPGNRIKAVNDEIPELGPAKIWATDDRTFESLKRHVISLPPPPKPAPSRP